MKKRAAVSLVVILAVLLCTNIAMANEKKSWNPFDTIWNAITQLQHQCSHLIGQPGPQGPVGPVGPQGLAGPIGPQGVQGENGSQGIQGEIGPQGPAGQIGPQGHQGMQGEQGIQGEQGEPGQDAQHGAGNIAFIDLSRLEVLTTDGQVFYVNQNTWTNIPQYNPPIPVEDIIQWSRYTLLDRNGNCWTWTSPNNWMNLGHP